jgi:hypothetical protein
MFSHLEVGCVEGAYKLGEVENSMENIRSSGQGKK